MAEWIYSEDHRSSTTSDIPCNVLLTVNGLGNTVRFWMYLMTDDLTVHLVAAHPVLQMVQLKSIYIRFLFLQASLPINLSSIEYPAHIPIISSGPCSRSYFVVCCTFVPMQCIVCHVMRGCHAPSDIIPPYTAYGKVCRISQANIAVVEIGCRILDTFHSIDDRKVSYRHPRRK